MTDRKTFPRIGVYVYGLATIAAGVVNLVWGSFESGHQPIQALGDHVPGASILAYIAAIWLVVGGAAILWPRSARAGAAALAVIYFIFGLFWLPRLISAPHVLGYRVDVFSGILAGVGQQFILVAAAMLVYAALSLNTSGLQREAVVARWIFGLSTTVFGIAHLTGTAGVAALVPTWIPLGGTFWVIFTGIAFVLAGVGITTGIQSVLAARLLALMLLIFSIIVLAPMIVAFPHDQGAWGANAYNLAAVGAALILADYLSSRRKPGRRP